MRKRVCIFKKTNLYLIMELFWDTDTHISIWRSGQPAGRRRHKLLLQSQHMALVDLVVSNIVFYTVFFNIHWL